MTRSDFERFSAPSSILATVEPVSTLMPRFWNERASVRPMSSSSSGSRFGSSSTSVTSEPKAENMVAHSVPTAPPPTITMRLGTSLSMNAPSELMTPGRSSPGIGNCAGVEPVAMMMCLPATWALWLADVVGRRVVQRSAGAERRLANADDVERRCGP